MHLILFFCHWSICLLIYCKLKSSVGEKLCICVVFCPGQFSGWSSTSATTSNWTGHYGFCCLKYFFRYCWVDGKSSVRWSVLLGFTIQKLTQDCCIIKLWLKTNQGCVRSFNFFVIRFEIYCSSNLFFFVLADVVTRPCDVAVELWLLKMLSSSTTLNFFMFTKCQKRCQMILRLFHFVIKN